MTIWLDAQLSPSVAAWITNTFGIEARAVRDLGLRDATDMEIFQAARSAEVVIMTKDKDFVDLQKRLGPPPQVLWLTCGNTSNARLREILGGQLGEAKMKVTSGESLIEIC